ncbi:hypothetical protein SAMD00019534_068230 [Acytostelium subglobosum LB1]|uniref:hypothetical protein n=1 Tax=Acytostelium subglobosum LB1 TaxID=1410327 RepID=UPI000644FA95|nr:hypothetical protein SAMD00019534_068230 [Acytostelium subglobosum LB1]GAM23648.1 hypothetical protein SAMD00019534_068230 [Acytostelium subglobosum LB1]|eukprot:XP_012753389.1 hypothetical protein SAMD00019534_068230 [Acytostelium subglobosum LB1]
MYNKNRSHYDDDDDLDLDDDDDELQEHDETIVVRSSTSKTNNNKRTRRGKRKRRHGKTVTPMPIDIVKDGPPPVSHDAHPLTLPLALPMAPPPVNNEISFHRTHMLYSRAPVAQYSIPKYGSYTVDHDVDLLLWNVFCKPITCSFNVNSMDHPNNDTYTALTSMSDRVMATRKMFVGVFKKLKWFPYDAILLKFVAESQGKQHNNFLTNIEVNASQLNIETLIGTNIEVHYVYRFVLTVINNLFPSIKLWGSHSNKSIFANCLLEYLITKKYKIYLDHFVSMFNCDQFIIGKLKYLRQFLWWMFEDLVPSIISNHFYCTNTASSKHYIYYIKSDWIRMARVQLLALKRSNYRSITFRDHNIFGNRRSGLSFLRFLPKEKSLRPIVNIGYPNTKLSLISDEGSSIIEYNFQESGNSLASRGVLPVLRYEIVRNPSLIGCTVGSRLHIYELFKNVKPILRTLKSIYMITLDINKCFDSLNQEKLMSIICDKVITHKDYLVTNMKTKSKLGHFETHTVATSADDLGHFIEEKTRLENRQSFKEFLSQTVPNSVDRTHVLEVLQELIFEHAVKYNDDTFIQKKGIPQGSVCSTTLCCLYLGDLDNRLLKPSLLKNDPGAYNMIARFVDDYFYITDSKKNADRFMDIFSNDTDLEYGVKCNIQKTLNFPDNTQSLIMFDDGT